MKDMICAGNCGFVQKPHAIITTLSNRNLVRIHSPQLLNDSVYQHCKCSYEEEFRKRFDEIIEH